MAAEFRITSDDTEWDGMDSSGIMTATRFLTLTADGGDQLTLAESNVIPQRGDAHPQHANWIVDSIGKIRHADIPNEYRLEVKYRKASGSVAITTNNEAKPWDLGIQNFRRSWTSIQEPLNQIFIPSTGAYRDLTNSAGQVIPAMAEISVLVISFDLNFEIRRGKRHVIAPIGTLNSSDETVCGEKVAPYAGKIMRMSSAEHKVYKNDGKTVKWHYETISYEIYIMTGYHSDPENPDSGKSVRRTWMLDFLNVGNMAKFAIPQEGKHVAKQIFQYTPWLSTDPDVNARVSPEFGCIDDVIAARNAYKKATGDKSKEIPWCEAENIPLVFPQGTIDRDALKGDKKYSHICGYQQEGESWKQYDIPTKAD